METRSFDLVDCLDQCNDMEHFRLQTSSAFSFSIATFVFRTLSSAYSNEYNILYCVENTEYWNHLRLLTFDCYWALGYWGKSCVYPNAVLMPRCQVQNQLMRISGARIANIVYWMRFLIYMWNSRVLNSEPRIIAYNPCREHYILCKVLFHIPRYEKGDISFPSSPENSPVSQADLKTETRFSRAVKHIFACRHTRSATNCCTHNCAYQKMNWVAEK